MGNTFYMIILVIVSLNLLVTLWAFYKEGNRRKDVIDPELDVDYSQDVINRFSNREKEIALAILEGKTNCEIAQEKCISPTTVKKHVYNLFQKANVRNRVEFINCLRNEGRNGGYSTTTLPIYAKH